MTAADRPPAVLVELFNELRARRFLLGVDDLIALRLALRAGFGLPPPGSPTLEAGGPPPSHHLIELAVTLWAKSATEAEVVRALFRRLDLSGWDDALGAPPQDDVDGDVAGAEPRARDDVDPARGPSARPTGGLGLAVARGELPAVPPLPVETRRRVVLAHQFPMTPRTVAQAFRRLRQPVRTGPAVELDVEATIRRRSTTGVTTAPVLVPLPHNRARLLLLLDQQGSMAPFAPLVRHVEAAITTNASLARVWVAHFHDCPIEWHDPVVLDGLARGLAPRLDPVLDAIAPATDGYVFADRELITPLPLADLLDEVGDDVGTVVVSDAGAVRRSYDPERLAATVAFARARHTRRSHVVWLNPTPRSAWAPSGAAELARHLPMYPADAAGLYDAVEVLRGRPPALEMPA